MNPGKKPRRRIRRKLTDMISPYHTGEVEVFSSNMSGAITIGGD